MKVAIRADATPTMGSGHAMRCLSLADALKARGASVRFVVRELPGHLAALVVEHGHTLAMLPPIAADESGDAEQTLTACAPCDWIVVDHYALGANWEAAMRQTCRVLAIDDLARPHRSDIVLDQNFADDAERRYAGRIAEGSTLLLGPHYALLAHEFAEARRCCRARDGVARRLHVFLGGMDAANVTETVLKAVALGAPPDLGLEVVIGAAHPARAHIEALCAARPDTQCHVQTSSMASLLAGADMAIGAGGSAIWERCALGVPTLALCVADNQRAVLHHGSRSGIVYAPEIAIDDVEAIALHLRALLANSGLRHHLSRNGLALVDGRGAERVAAALMDTGITTRRATLADSRQLHDWRNDAAVRAVSRNAAEIDYADHERWLRGVLASSTRHLLIGERDGAAVGVVRFDVSERTAEVSIHLVPARFGRGEGRALLRAAEAWLRREDGAVESLRAHVNAGNVPSQRLFEAGGYSLAATQFIKRIRP